MLILTVSPCPTLASKRETIGADVNIDINTERRSGQSKETEEGVGMADPDSAWHQLLHRSVLGKRDRERERRGC